jgi:hypothetical protein
MSAQGRLGARLRAGGGWSPGVAVAGPLTVLALLAGLLVSLPGTASKGHTSSPAAQAQAAAVLTAVHSWSESIETIDCASQGLPDQVAVVSASFSVAQSAVHPVGHQAAAGLDVRAKLTVELPRPAALPRLTTPLASLRGRAPPP